MALLDAFKQQVLSLGRSEARAKARPLLVGDESFERSAAGLDQRTSEKFVLFWLLSDRALYLVAGGSDADWAFRVPYADIAEMSLQFDEHAEMLPWHIRIELLESVRDDVTTLGEEADPGNPLAPPPPRTIVEDEWRRLVRGEIIPIEGYAATSRKFRSTLAHHLASTDGILRIRGEDKAEAQRRLKMKRKSAPKADG